MDLDWFPIIVGEKRTYYCSFKFISEPAESYTFVVTNLIRVWEKIAYTESIVAERKV